MTIKELLLKAEATLVLNGKVMVGDDTTGQLVIFLKDEEIYRGTDEDVAVETLLETE